MWPFKKQEEVPPEDEYLPPNWRTSAYNPDYAARLMDRLVDGITGLFTAYKNDPRLRDWFNDEDRFMGDIEYDKYNHIIHWGGTVMLVISLNTYELEHLDLYIKKVSLKMEKILDEHYLHQMLSTRISATLDTGLPESCRERARERLMKIKSLLER